LLRYIITSFNDTKAQSLYFLQHYFYSLLQGVCSWLFVLSCYSRCQVCQTELSGRTGVVVEHIFVFVCLHIHIV
jgi:hypothetical protein